MWARMQYDRWNKEIEMSKLNEKNAEKANDDSKAPDNEKADCTEKREKTSRKTL